MAEYIDRKTLMKIFRVNCKLSHGIPKQIYCKVIKTIKQLPVVDAEEVVRCKHCEYSIGSGLDIHCRRCGLYVAEDNYCGYGEIKRNGDGG